MIIKSFTGPTVAAALKQVRDEMGGDAVVLKTRVLPIDETKIVNERVEVTACIDESILSPGKIDYILQKNERTTLTSAKDKSSVVTQPVLSKDVLAELKIIHQELINADIPEKIVLQLTADIKKNYSSESNIRDIAATTLAGFLNQYMISEIDFKPGMKILFTGFSGAGKTSALAKLAAQLVSGLGLKVTLSSLDDMKVSAFEEMGSYADILNLPSAMFDELEERHTNNSLILIDTPPLPVDPMRRQELLKKIKKVNPDKTFLVFSVRGRSSDLTDAVEIFKAVSPDYLIAGHLDETKRWGAIYSMVELMKTPLAFTTNSPGGIGELSRTNAAEIARTVLTNGGTNEIK